MACRPQFRKKINPFYVQQWWILTMLFLLKCAFLPVIVYGLLVTTVMTTVYTLRSTDFDNLNIEDLLFYVSLFAMKKTIICAIFSTKKLISLYMTCSLRLISYLLSMIYELIANSQHKLIKILFYGIRLLYVVDNSKPKTKGRLRNPIKLSTSNQRN